jgi:hypothetical protein
LILVQFCLKKHGYDSHQHYSFDDYLGLLTDSLLVLVFHRLVIEQLQQQWLPHETQPAL